MKIDGSIRIGLSTVDATWRTGGRAAPWRKRERFASENDEQARANYGEVAAALDRLLAAKPAGRRLFSPHLRIALADPHLQLAVIRFSQLPRSRKDIDLLVTQRFCRDHRIEPNAASFAYALQKEAHGEHHVMVCALNATLGSNISQLLHAHRLHADVFTAESIYTIRALPAALLRAPSLVLLLYDDYATIVFWSGPGIANHIGVFQQRDRSRREFLTALNARLERYATSHENSTHALAVDVLTCGEDQTEAAAFQNLPYAVRDLRREPALARIWPTNRPLWETIVEAGG